MRGVTKLTVRFQHRMTQTNVSVLRSDAAGPISMSQSACERHTIVTCEDSGAALWLESFALFCGGQLK